MRGRYTIIVWRLSKHTIMNLFPCYGVIIGLSTEYLSSLLPRSGSNMSLLEWHTVRAVRLPMGASRKLASRLWAYWSVK